MSVDDSTTRDLVGTVVDGRFEVIGKLGEGGMGAIYRARQLSMERMVALKILLRNRRGDPFRSSGFAMKRTWHQDCAIRTPS